MSTAAEDRAEYGFIDGSVEVDDQAAAYAKLCERLIAEKSAAERQPSAGVLEVCERALNAVGDSTVPWHEEDRLIGVALAAIQAAKAAPVKAVSALTSEEVFAYIAHGDEQHRAWLKSKCDELFVVKAEAPPVHIDHDDAETRAAVATLSRKAEAQAVAWVDARIVVGAKVIPRIVSIDESLEVGAKLYAEPRAALMSDDELRAECERRGAMMCRWEPIETAEENESLIVIQQPGFIAWAMYKYDDAWFLNGEGEEMVISPTNWLSGLKPPKDSHEQG